MFCKQLKSRALQLEEKHIKSKGRTHRPAFIEKRGPGDAFITSLISKESAEKPLAALES
jgi:hypothetical protein